MGSSNDMPLPSGGGDVQRLPIELVQRKFQGRHEVVWGGPIGWPAAQCCEGAPTPPYPKDGFYGEKLTHQKQLELVQDLCVKFYNTQMRVFGSFVKRNQLEGSATIPFYGDADFPLMNPSDITLYNYAAKFDEIKRNVEKLTHVQLSGQINPIGEDGEIPEGRAGGGSGVDCDSAKQEASGYWDECAWVPHANNVWLPINGNIKLREDGSCSQFDDPYYAIPFGAGLFSTRGRIRVTLTPDVEPRVQKGSAEVFLWVAPFQNGSSNDPPVAADSTWHKWHDIPLGGVWTSELLANRKPDFTVGCPQGVYDIRGWEIVTVAVIAAPQFRESPDPGGCGCGAVACTLGGDAGSAGCLDFQIGLGHTSGADFAGLVYLHEEAPKPELAQPAGLRWTADAEAEVIDPGDVLRQVKAPQGLMDVVPDATNAYRYFMRFYYTSQVGAKDGSGLYTINSGQQNNWYRQITVENPDFTPGQPLGAYNRLKITNADGPSPGTVLDIKLFEYTASSDQWALSSGWDATAGQYLRWEARAVAWNTGHTQRTETFTVRNNSSTGTVAYKEVLTYQVFDWGEQLVQRQVDPDGANLTTTWAYYTNAADTANYGKLKQVTDDKGFWQKFTYDTSGRVTKVVSQYQSQPDTATDANSVVVERTYEGVDILNGSGRPGTDGTTDLRETFVEKVGGVEVARRYRVTSLGTNWDYEWDIRCATAGAAWNDAANRVTITKRYKQTAASHPGEVASVLEANGDATAFYRTTVYTFDGSASDAYLGSLVVDTVKEGTPSTADPEVVSFGTETVTKRHALGETVSRIVYPINSGTTDTSTAISSKVVPADATNDYLDEFGQVERLNYLDGTYGTTTYDHGRKSSERDRQGIVTSYTYDPLRRVASETQAPGTSGALTRLFTYDAAGRVTQTKRKGTDNVTLTVETLTYDLAGRLTRRTDALSKSTYYTYRRYTDATSGKTYNESRTYPHNRAAGPVQVTWADGRGQAVRSFNGTPAADWAPSTPSGTETLTESARREWDYDWRGRMSKERAYHDLAAPAYYETTYVYDTLDRLLRTKDGMGNVAATVYDGQGRPASEWRGTNDTGATAASPSAASPNDMVKVAETYYDTNRDGTGQDRPFVTRAKRLRPVSTLSFTYTDFDYDSRRRLEWTKPASGGAAWTQAAYDLGNRVLSTTTYRNGSTSYVVAKSSTAYDSLGRPTSSKTHEADGSGGLTGNALETTYAYDDAGRQVKVTRPLGGFTKMLFDVLSRVDRTAFCATEGADTTVSTLAGDIVVEETVFAYDAVDNVIQTTSYARNHDATATGALSANAGSARPRYVCTWYDESRRPTYVVDYGTNGGQSFTRPSTPPEPNTSDSYIVAKTVYDLAGNIQQQINNRGVISRWEYDGLSRRTKQVENYVDGVAGTGDNDQDRITTYAYNSDGQLTSITADMPGTTPDQTTTYIYSASLSDKGGPVKSNSYLSAITYPGSDDGVSGGALSNGTDGVYDRVEFTYQADGSLATRKDMRQVTLGFAYDDAGRLTEQKVTAGTVQGDQQIKYTYTDLGKPDKLTTYSVIDTTVSNEVQYAYDGFGQVTTEYQAHSGAVNTANSPKVQYAYDTTTSGGVFTKGRRARSMTYPNGRILRYEYNSGVDDVISRMSYLADDSGGSVGIHLEEYSYLGADTIVERNRPQPGTKLTYVQAGGSGDGGDQYVGLDRFGRVTDHRWMKTSTNTDLDRFKYRHDRAGNRLFKENTVSAPNSELYHGGGVTGGYDKLDRLTDFKRGTLSDSNADGVLDTISSPSITKTWSLDVLGNWTGVTGEGSNRQHNVRNQVVQVNGSTLSYDANGNMIIDETGKRYTYDAWDRLLKVRNAADTADVVTYKCDPKGRRIVENAGTARDLFYSMDWQALEERESSLAKSQFVWGLGYVDALILRDRDIDNIAGNGLEERLYAQQDGNWNATSVTNTSGVVQERYLYDPYGAATILTSSWAALSASAFTWLYLHQCGRLDTATGLYTFRNRDHSPVDGRWIQSDPLDYRDGLHRYQYEQSNPIIHVDPLGLAAICRFDVVPLGKQPAQPLGNGAFVKGVTQITDWDIQVEGVSVGCKAGCFKLHLVDAFAGVNYWWADESSRKHELLHVNGIKKIWGKACQELTTTVKKASKCLPAELQNCNLAFVFMALNSQYKAALALEKQRDCEIYGKQFPAACQQANALQAQALQEIAQATSVAQECIRRFDAL